MAEANNSNPWHDKTDAELLQGAEKFAEAQVQMASRTNEDMTHWHHRSVAWLLTEMALRLRRRPLRGFGR
jgi:hypothetical protein